MGKQIVKNGDFRTSLNAIYCGELNTLGFNSVVINVNSKQLTTSTPTPLFKLNVYKSNNPYQEFATDNINEMELFKTFNLKCSINSKNGGIVDQNNDLSQVVNCNSHYLVFTMESASIQDLSFNFSADCQHNSVEEYKARDAYIELNEIGILTKPITDFKVDVQSNKMKGLSVWSMSCKGDITNSEYLLFEDAINTLGYFDTAGQVHKANQIVASSTSSSDDHTDIGARSIKITGLNGSFNEVSEHIIMNGTSDVYLATQMTEVNSAEVVGSGGLYCNAGTIKIFNTDTNGGTSANPMCTIPMNYGLHQNSQYCVPLGYSLIIQKVMISSHCEDESEILFNKYQWGGSNTNINKHRIKTYHLHSSTTVNEDVHLTLKEKERFTITAQTSTAPTGINRISVEVFGYLKLNKFTQSSNNSYNDAKYIEGEDVLPISLPYV